MSTESDGFNIAFAFVDYGNSQQEESYVLEDYGTIKTYYKKWGVEGLVGTNYFEIPSRPCTEAELGLNQTDNSNDESRFWPINPVEKSDLKSYASSLKCMDENLLISGAYNSAKAQHLTI